MFTLLLQFFSFRTLPKRKGLSSLVGLRCLALGVLAVLVALGANAQIKGLTGRFKGFKVPGYSTAKPGQSAQLKWVVVGNEARQLENGLFQVQGLLFEFYGEKGETNVHVEAAEGLFDQTNRTVYSSGPLKVLLSGGQVDLTGQGFLCQTNGFLVVSNQVQTILRQKQNIHLRAHRFEYNDKYDEATGLAVYRGQVEGRDTNMVLTCEQLQVQVPKGDQVIEHIVAETNVVLLRLQDQSRAQGQRAEYRSQEGRHLIELSGNPFWQRGQSEGRADRFVIDREAETVRAIGHARLKLTRSEMSQPGSLLSVTEPAGQSTRPAEGFVEIQADQFLKLADGALFEGQVRINDPAAGGSGTSSSCDRLRVKTNAKDELESVTMEDNLLLTQGEKIRVQGQKLFYAKAQEIVEITGQPSWAMEEFKGSAERLRFDRQHGILTAEGQARIRLPRSTASQSLWAFEAQPAQPPPAQGETYLEASAQRYIYTRQPGLVRFEENVRVQEYRQGQANSQLTCAVLQVHLKETNQIEHIDAEQGVVFERVDPANPGRTNSTEQLHCDSMRLTTTPDGRLDTAVAEGNVQFHQADKRVWGQRMVYQAATDQLICTGAPVRVEAAEGNLTSDQVSLNRRENRRVARGNIQIQIDVPQARATGGSNLLRTPLPARPGL